MQGDELHRTWKLLVAVVQPYVGEAKRFFGFSRCVRVEIVLGKSNLFFFFGTQACLLESHN
jgi:hypothetical protein